MKTIFTVICLMALTVQSYAAVKGLFPLTSTGELPAEVVRSDDDTVTLKVTSGVQRVSWWDLDLQTADHIGRTSGQFRILDRRTISSNDVRLVRAIVSKRYANGEMRYYVHQRYTSPKRSGTEHECWQRLDSPPVFVDDNTILVRPDNVLLAYRDFDGDHLPEKITMERQSEFTINGLVDKDPESKKIHTWRVSFNIADRAYCFKVRSKTIPPIPEPCDVREECVAWDGHKLNLADLRVGHTESTMVLNYDTESHFEEND